MHRAWLGLFAPLFLFLACPPAPCRDGQCEPVGLPLGDEASDAGDSDAGQFDGGAPDAGRPELSALLPVPIQGQEGKPPLDCSAAYALPADFTGADGLGRFGWTLDDIKLRLAWNQPNAFTSRWLSDNTDQAPSLRVRPWLVPSAGACFRRGLSATDGGVTDLEAVLSHASAFNHRSTAFDALYRDAHPAYEPVRGDEVFLRALKGLFVLPNSLRGAPKASWTPELEDKLRGATRDYPQAMQEALAELVLAVGAAYLQKDQALGQGDRSAYARIHQQFLQENYATLDNSFVTPKGGTSVQDIRAQADAFDVGAMHLSAQRLARSARRALSTLEAVAPFDSPDLDVLTPHGRVMVRTQARNDTYGPTTEEAALVVDLGGNDVYDARHAATLEFWQSASVLIDVRGDDRYNPRAADPGDAATTARAAFDRDHGFTQGSGLFGVGLLLDGAGNDVYTAAVHAQGSGAFGVGVLWDLGGDDTYRLAFMGQGAGFFGQGTLVDEQGNDQYRLYTMGQGAGKPGGQGLLLDRRGNDLYHCYHEEHLPELPGKTAPNHYNLPPSFSYNDGTKAHYMSVCQGVGWGYRADWVSPQHNWMGGFGALVDLGDGNDVHEADVMSMGQGFIYGLGLLYDEGGDDRYRAFWWGMGAAAHMGLGLLWENAGNDDLYMTRASGGFGFDTGVGWTLNLAGNDRYGGQLHYGESYNYGLSFFVEGGGDDAYNHDGKRTTAYFGAVNRGYQGAKLIGAFLDLGGTDRYVNAPAEVQEGATWSTPPFNPLSGQQLDPLNHKAFGLDRP